jgi:nucleoid-associated protein YgaU
MMSRELKLALILGFAAVMVVGVLISDHMSGARQARIEERTLQTPPLALSTPSSGDYAVAPQHQPERLTQALPENNPQVASAPDAAVVDMGSPVTTDEPSTALADAGGPSNAIGDFLAWSEKQGVRFEEIAPPTPLLQTHPRNGNSAPSRELPDATPVSPAAERTHVVEEGESLWGIAQQYYGNGALFTRIEEANKGRLGKGDSLYVGATLIIPGADGATTKPTAAPKRNESPRNAFTPKKAAPAERFHVVQKGETLGDIAKKTLGSAKRWPDIVKANKGTITDPDNVPAGLRIRIPEN